MSFFFLFPCCPADARAASSSSSFLIRPPLLLLATLVILLISSWWRATHISSQPGRVALPKILWTNVSHSSEIAFRAVMTINFGSSVDPTKVSWSQISYNLRRNGSMCSPFCIWYDRKWFSNSILRCTKEPWYNMVRVSHISFAVLFSAICGMKWSLTLSRIIHFALTIASL